MRKKALKYTFLAAVLIAFATVPVQFDNFWKQGIKKDELNDYQAWEKHYMEENPDYNNLSILIDVNEKALYLLKDNREVLKKYTIATGKPSTPTPLGRWKIISKARWGGGFGSRWMGLNVPWGKYGIHGTNKPSSIGYNVSGGCIRMFNRDVEELYKYVKYGTPVVITGGPFGPFGNGMRNLYPGDRGIDVVEVQKRLKLLGYYKGSIDGVYGPIMERALYKFQKDVGMPKTSTIYYDTYRAMGIIMME